MSKYSPSNDKYVMFKQYPIDFRYNKYIYDWLKKLPRLYTCYDYKRFEKYGYIEDIKSIPQLYKEPVLRLFDLGIYVYDKSPIYYQKVRAKPGKTLTEQEAQTLIDRLFDEKKRDVFDEVTYDSALYMTQTGDVICGRSNLGNIDILIQQMAPFSETQVISELDAVVFETPVATVRVLPGAAKTLKYQLEHSESFKMGYWHRLALVPRWYMWQEKDKSLYMTFYPTYVIKKKSGMPIVGRDDSSAWISPTSVSTLAFGEQLPDAVKGLWKLADYLDKPGVLKAGKPGALVKCPDFYYYEERISDGQDVVLDFVSVIYFVQPDVEYSKYIVFKPDPKYK
ncbi:hypothetical protein [Caldicellulosiruptor naganoensis]|uniref:Uncharacterized protein n=1 Tax=Caldicellulosiruptor naganoensis TaxID=29324 RepID=A0ABY7BFR4_9FIRM|nr:hypothetical protein [Caldicellulosiruptor naganoensis]WAM31654.1 hypothetical protein OTJ99_000085 [Caldicellulosiruptor naganoensis]